MENEKPIVPDAPRWKTYPNYIADEPPVTSEKNKKSHAPVSVAIITFQVLIIIILVFYILVFTEIKESSLYTMQQYLPPSVQNNLAIFQGVGRKDMSGVFVVEREGAKREEEHTSVYSETIDQAGDLKRKANLSALATAMVMYYAEYGFLPEGFPKEMRCIGTDPSCYDLYKVIVPLFLEKPFIDANGSLENTGYSIGASQDGTTLVVVQSLGENGEIIEARK